MATKPEDVLKGIQVAMQRIHGVIGHQLRNQHPKGHGVVQATFEVRSDVPESLRVGLFRQAGTYSAFVRFSNGKSADDTQPDVHGMAIKVRGVTTTAGANTEQDFVLSDSPAFFAKDAVHFLQFLHMKGKHGGQLIAARAAGKAESDLKTLEVQQKNETVAAFPALMTFASAPEKSLLTLTYHSQTPYRLGAQIVKYKVIADTANVCGTMEKSTDCFGKELAQTLQKDQRSAAFTLGVVVQTNDLDMPIEDATHEWKGEFVPLATLTIPAQEFLTPEKIKAGNALEFSPWHALPEHEPVGTINQARQLAYADSAGTRHANAAVIRRFYQSFAAGDYQGMQDCLHPDVEFHDLGFDLKGKAEVGAMWQMLCLKPEGIRIQVRNIRADAEKGSANWECDYTFQKDPTSEARPIHNQVVASFVFKDGLIVGHKDECDFWTWFVQAMGPAGVAARLADQVEDRTVAVLHVEEKARAGVKEAARKKLDYFLGLISGAVTPPSPPAAK